MDYKNVNDYEILYRIEEKDDYAIDVLYKKYNPVIRGIAVKYLPFVSNKGVELDDLMQEGYLGLCSAIKNYRDNQNSLFYTYACLCIHRFINTYYRRVSSRKHVILNNSIFDEQIIINSTDYEINSIDAISNNILDYENFVEYKNAFDLKYSSVFELRYNGFTYREIAELLDVSLSTVDGRLSKIRKTLHHVIKKTT